MEQSNPYPIPVDLLPNPPNVNEPPNNPLKLPLPDTRSYTIKVLDNTSTQVIVKDDEIYFFAPHSVRVGVRFQKSGKLLMARVSNMKVGEFHSLLVPHIPESERQPLIFEWMREGNLERRTLVKLNDFWDEVTVGLGGEDIGFGIQSCVVVQDA